VTDIGSETVRPGTDWNHSTNFAGAGPTAVCHVSLQSMAAARILSRDP
jgi:hypothetical protein